MPCKCAREVRTQEATARFWAKVNKDGPNGCWVWTASTTPFGYGKFGIHGQSPALAHRYSYELAYGRIPDGMKVLHGCDNPSCVNPAHLFLGTQADNLADMYAKGRWKPGKPNPQHGDDHYLRRHPERIRRGFKHAHPENMGRGDTHYNAKLTERDVIAIRHRYAAGNVIMSELAAEYNVSKGTIQKVLERKTWKHVP